MILLAARLKLALLRGGLRAGPGSTQRRVGMALSVVLGSLLALLGFLTLAALRGRAEADDATVALFCFLVATWSVIPILTFSSDDLVDPAKLALLPLSRRQVLVLHGVGALVGVAPVATLLAVSGAVVGTSSSWASAAVAAFAVVLELAMCVVLSRTVVSALSRLLRSRRGRDLGVALTALTAISVQFLNPVLQNVSRSAHAADELHSVAGVLAWFPPGLAATMPRAARDGHWLTVLWHLALVVAVLGLLLRLWEGSLRRAEEVPDATTSRPERGDSALVPALLSRLVPRGRIGAVAGKDLRYLSREPRRLVQLVTSAIFPALFVVISPALYGSHLTHGMVFAVCGIALFFGLQGANRFGQESTASWHLVAAGIDLPNARRDLLGGDVAATLVGVPLVLSAGLVLSAVTGGWDLLVPALASAVCVLGLSFGGGAMLSVFAPFPVPEGPRNAFSNGGGGQGVAAGLLGLLVMAGVVLAALPMLPLLLTALDGSPLWLVLVAPLYGVVLGSGVRELAARQWSVRGPEILLKVAAQR
ncbi:MAG: hypothetical protein JWO22_2093 [Frankiales bacterium]|nr:hypothetical protein [Frankiales bacterium]